MSISNDCQYIAHKNAVHEFIFEKSSRASVDFLMDNMGGILDNTPLDDPILLIIDLRKSGVPPLRYVMLRSKQVNKRYFQEHVDKKQHTAYIAIISNNSIIQTFKIFVEQIARGTTRVKICGEREDALAWLLSNKENVT